MNNIRLFLLVTLVAAPSLSKDAVKLGVATVGEEQFCVGYRTEAWTNQRFLLNSAKTFRVKHCSQSDDDRGPVGYNLGGIMNQVSATLIDSSCDLSHTPTERYVFVKAPFSKELDEQLNISYYTGVMQVRGDLKSAVLENSTVVVRPIEFGKIYWGAIIMYFFSLVYVSICAVLVEAGRHIVEGHAPTSPIVRVPCTQTRIFLVIFLVLFMLILTVAFTGYFLYPVPFQPFFALFLSSLAVVGFYHIVFPIIVLLAVKYVRVVNKTYWMVERTSVVLGGVAIFAVWMNYRTVPNIWPLQLLMFACVGVVPIRYAPVNCIAKCLVFTLIGVFFSVLQRYILPAVVAGKPPHYVDIVTIQARIPDTISPGALFFPDDLEANMMSFRLPVFLDAAPCTTVIDGTFGLTNFILPALFIKAALLTDLRINNGTILVKNYTTGVVCYLFCHIAVFVWSFVAETPVNSSIIYLPGITLSLIINSLRMGYLREAFYPPPPDPQPLQPQTARGHIPNIVVYKVTADDQI